MNLRRHLLQGQVIPAHPLALDDRRRLDDRRQRALTRYYLAAGAGGIAVGVHTTQFAIRDSEHGLYEPVLALASKTADDCLARHPRPFAKIAGICGLTPQAVREAACARSLGYQAGLLSLAAWKGAEDAAVLHHCRTVAGVIPLFGFYLQPAVGGHVFGYHFWREFAEIPEVVAIKIAPFNRYQTLDVIRAVADAGRDDIALYTGNDDNIVLDLLSRFPFGQRGMQRIVGGLLGHWAVWTRRAVELLDEIKNLDDDPVPVNWLTRALAITDMNAALFDPQNRFAGCIPGIHEVLRRQGLLEHITCLDPHEQLSPDQAAEIDRVLRCYPDLTDDAFVQERLDEWLS